MGQQGKSHLLLPSFALPPEPSRFPHHLRDGKKTVFHETGPWCPKGWGPLLQIMCLSEQLKTVQYYKEQRKIKEHDSLSTLLGPPNYLFKVKQGEQCISP